MYYHIYFNSDMSKAWHISKKSLLPSVIDHFIKEGRTIHAVTYSRSLWGSEKPINDDTLAFIRKNLKNY